MRRLLVLCGAMSAGLLALRALRSPYADDAGTCRYPDNETRTEYRLRIIDEVLEDAGVHSGGAETPREVA
jgi:hypothetical protein